MPRGIPVMEAEQRQTKGFAADFQAEKTAANRLCVYSISISFSGNGSLPTRKGCAFVHCGEAMAVPFLIGTRLSRSRLVGSAFSFENRPSGAT